MFKYPVGTIIITAIKNTGVVIDRFTEYDKQLKLNHVYTIKWSDTENSTGGWGNYPEHMLEGYYHIVGYTDA